MNPRPAPLRPRTDIEASRRQMYLLLASLACLSQLTVTALVGWPGRPCTVRRCSGRWCAAA